MSLFSVDPLRKFEFKTANGGLQVASLRTAIFNSGTTGDDQAIISDASVDADYIVRIMGYDAQSGSAGQGTYALKDGNAGTYYMGAYYAPPYTGAPYLLPVTDSGYWSTTAGKGVYVNVTGQAVKINLFYCLVFVGT